MTYLFDSVSVTHYILLHNRTLSKHVLNQILIIANLLDLTLQYTVKSDIKQVHAFDTEYCYTNINQHFVPIFTLYNTHPPILIKFWHSKGAYYTQHLMVSILTTTCNKTQTKYIVQSYYIHNPGNRMHEIMMDQTMIQKPGNLNLKSKF